MDEPLIEINGLSFRYGRSRSPALADIDMTIRNGEFIVITGPSGCGKSTLCRCLNGLIPHSTDGQFTGQVLVKGKDTKECDVSDLSSYMGMVFQDPENQLLSNVVEMEVAFGPENLGLSPEEIEERVTWALAVTGIERLRDRLIDELSGGEKQRVAIAAAMAMRPEILVLDEPTSEIDPLGAHAIIDMLKSLNKNEGLTVVLIEHRLERLLGAMSRLVILDRGRIIHDGCPEDVFKNDVGGMGVFVPTLVQFSNKFGLPFIESLDDIRPDGPWRADIRDRPVNRDAPIASLKDVRYRYPGTGTDALKGISIDIYCGEIISIMGVNGSGKTTLVKHLNGLLKPSGGQVLLNGEDIEGRTVAENARSVGFVFQNVNHQLFEETVLGELLFGPVNLGLPRDSAVKKAHEVAASLDLEEEDLAVSPFLLSGGEKQRVAIASSLIPGPAIVVLDEPTLGLNQGLKEKLAAILVKMKGEGKAVVLVTHDVEFAAAYADRVILMAGGQVVVDDGARNILTSDWVHKASLQYPQATEIGKKLGVDGILSIEELVPGGA